MDRRWMPEHLPETYSLDPTPTVPNSKLPVLVYRNVLPDVADAEAAGVSHHSVTSAGEYEYVGLYPEGSPHYDNNFCKAGEQETIEKAKIASEVPIPENDPVFGKDGPLPALWNDALGNGLE
ncbi:MAG: hypothetical protein Q9227_000355 [Pyrenula ochraceoflavens]